MDALGVLAENVLLMQQLAYRGKLHRVLSIPKMRFSAHDYRLREFIVASPEGIRVLTSDESGEEVLTGLAEVQAGNPVGESISHAEGRVIMREPARGTKEPPLILIVDDEISIAETLAEFVMELGYTPLVAYNGQQALSLARERWPALVLTDLMMPLLNGAGLIRALRTEAEAGERAFPYVVLLSAVVRGSMLVDLDVDAIVPEAL